MKSYSIPVSLYSQFGISNFSVVIYALKTLLFLSNSIHVVVSCSKSPKNSPLVQLLTELLKFLYFLQSRKYINRDTIPLYCGIVLKMLMCNNLEESFILNYEISRSVLYVDNEKRTAIHAFVGLPCSGQVVNGYYLCGYIHIIHS